MYMPILPSANWARSGSMSRDSTPGSMLPSSFICLKELMMSFQPLKSKRPVLKS
ncbi:hypothetical protein D3C71_1765920 [compost metagenome]